MKTISITEKHMAESQDHTVEQKTAKESSLYDLFTLCSKAGNPMECC